MRKFKPFIKAITLCLVTLILLAACNNVTTQTPILSPTNTPVPTRQPPIAPPTATSIPTVVPPNPTALISRTANGLTDSRGTPLPTRRSEIVLADPDAVDVSPRVFLDDRSSPIQVLRSYYNAINRKEYVRAYSYWSNSANPPPPAYDVFQRGFTSTASVELTISKAVADGTAGTTYYRAPVTIYARQTNNQIMTYVGCYVISQPNPVNFGAPPFIPMGIYSAKIELVQNYNTNFNDLMDKACNN